MEKGREMIEERLENIDETLFDFSWPAATTDEKYKFMEALRKELLRH